MGNTEIAAFEQNSFSRRLKSMLSVDFRRMFTMRLFYIMAGTCLVLPILILVMTTTMGDPDAPEAAEAFTNTWQIIGSLSGGGSGMSMDLAGMCNINMLYFLGAVLACLFVTEDFKSGYAKNLFAVRAHKSDYVISKTAVCFAGCAGMLIAFFAGTMIGGAIAGLSFDPGAAGIIGIVMCMLSKIFLMLVFTAIYVTLSVVAKQKTWVAMVGSFCIAMLLFTMIPTLTPLDATIVNVLSCLIGGAILSFGLGAVSDIVLKKTSLV